MDPQIPAKNDHGLKSRPPRLAVKCTRVSSGETPRRAFLPYTVVPERDARTDAVGHTVAIIFRVVTVTFHNKIWIAQGDGLVSFAFLSREHVVLKVSNDLYITFASLYV